MLKNKIIYNNFSNWSFDISRTEGSFLWDINGKKLIDFTSGWNVTNLGWNNIEIAEAIIKQAKKNVYVPGWTGDPVQYEYADLLIKTFPKALRAIAKATGGTEANEEAIKTARAFNGRKKILGFKNTYHGHSFATLAIGYLPEDVVSKAISPMLQGFVQMDFPKVYGKNQNEKKILADFEEKLERILAKEDIAAVISESGIITGWGSTYVAPDGYLSLVRKLTQKYGTLLILDEVGTGFSRLGKLYGMELENITPDIITFAKGMVNGAAAIGAMVTTKEIAEKTCDKTNIYSTFGWTPIACAAALKTLEIHLRDRIWEKAAKDGEYLLNSFKRGLENNPLVEDIKGKGMEIGVHLVKTQDKKPIVKKIVEKAREKGLFLVDDNEANIQIMPPLTITKDILDKGLDIFISIVKSIK